MRTGRCRKGVGEGRTWVKCEQLQTPEKDLYILEYTAVYKLHIIVFLIFRICVNTVTIGQTLINLHFMIKFNAKDSIESI